MSLRLPNEGLSPSSTTTELSPYRWALPSNVEVEPDPLQLRLDFHAETVVLHDYTGPSARVRVVSALDVAHTLARELDLSSGLLPADTLWWARTSTGHRIAVWREPRVWLVRLREAPGVPLRRMRLPMPGLVFVCGPQGAPYVFAARKRPRSESDQLYCCPCYNVFPTGRVCPGTETFPADPARVPETFFRSAFSPHAGHGKSQRYPDDVGRLWAEIRGRREFPLDDLVAQLQVGDALRLGG